MSDKPGVCETNGCKKEGQPLTECNCTDGKHEEAMKRVTSEDTGEEAVQG